MARTYELTNIRHKFDNDTGEKLVMADVIFTDGKSPATMKNHVLVECYRCGSLLMPGSINEGEGFHIDGCDDGDPPEERECRNDGCIDDHEH